MKNEYVFLACFAMFFVMIYMLSEKFEEVGGSFSFGPLSFGVHAKGSALYLSKEELELATS